MYVRVAISLKFDKVLFQFPTRIIAKIVVENTTVVAFLVDFVCKPHLFSEVCPRGPRMSPRARVSPSNLLSEKDELPKPNTGQTQSYSTSGTQSNIKNMNTSHVYNSTLCQDLSEDGNSRMFLATPLGRAGETKGTIHP